jgi:hypothetical protein
MTARPLLAAFVSLALSAAPTLAQNAPSSGGQEQQGLKNDGNVQQNQQPENTPQGRAPPNEHKTDSGLALQQAIDAAHKNSTGITRDHGTRSPGNQPEGFRDGEAPRMVLPAN